MMRYSYLFVDLFTILIPFIYTFHPKIRFDKSWKSFFPAMVIAAIFFLIWDEVFTYWGVWGFNSDYLIGISIGHLPLEEILFFVCIPYSCVFTYFCFKKFKIIYIFSKNISKIMSIVMILILLIIGLWNFQKDYTFSTFILISLFLLWHQFKNNSDYLPQFYFTYLIILIPFFIVNGILTGTGIDTPVVWYNDIENLGIRMGTIPVEDTFYGMLLILLNVTIFEYLEKKNQNNSSIG